MKINTHVNYKEQFAQVGRHYWSVPRLVELSKGFPVTEALIDHLNVWVLYERLTLRELVMHMKAVQAADLGYPIILDEDGYLMDGRHRLMKAMLIGVTHIKVVRFDENPAPCKEDPS